MIYFSAVFLVFTIIGYSLGDEFLTGVAFSPFLLTIGMAAMWADAMLKAREE